MPTKNKFVKKYITWVIGPKGAYLDCIMSDSEKDAPKRFEHSEDDHFWDGAKFIHVPIQIQVPKELESLVQEDYHDR